MPGLYTHMIRNTGDNITATIYNTDHQNHIDNLEPAKVDDYSASAMQMRSTVDPGESGSESLATTLAGELERLRFAIKEMKGTTYWYQSLQTCTVQPTIAFLGGSPGAGLRDGVTDQIFFYHHVPGNYVSGPLSLNVLFHATATGNTIVLRTNGTRYRNNVGFYTPLSSFNWDYIPTDTNDHAFSFAMNEGTFTAGDMIIWNLSRLGADGGDGNTGNFDLGGATVTYTGYAGRP